MEYVFLKLCNISSLVIPYTYPPVPKFISGYWFKIYVKLQLINTLHTPYTYITGPLMSTAINYTLNPQNYLDYPES